MSACLQGVRHQLNAQPRRSLQGSSPAQSFYHSPRLCASRPERTAIFHWIWGQAQRRLSLMEHVTARSFQAAWRHAAESWLRAQGLITITHHTENQ